MERLLLRLLSLLLGDGFLATLGLLLCALACVALFVASAGLLTDATVRGRGGHVI